MIRTISFLALLLLATAPAAAQHRVVKIRGNEAFEASDLRAAARADLVRYRRTGELAAAEDAAFEILTFYRGEGHALAEATVEEEEEGVTIHVREGPRFLLGDVVVTGTEVGDPEDLAAFVDVPKTWLFGSRLFVVGDLRAAGESMRSWLRERGYLEARVRGPLHPDLSGIADLTGDVVVDVGYEIEDGPPARLDGLQLTVDREVPFGQELLRVLSRSTGKPYAPSTPFDLRSAATEVCGQHGHPFAEATVEESFLEMPDRVSVVVKVFVRPGPVTKIRRVDIHGNVRTRDHIVRRELEVLPWDVYDSRAVRRTRRQLFDTRLFRQTDVKVLAPSERETLLDLDETVADVEVDLGEADYRRLETSIGWGSWELLRGAVSYSWLNLWGTGRRVTVELAGSFRGGSFSVSGYQPWLFGLPHVDGLVEAKVEQQERPSFTYDQLSLSTTASKEVARHLTVSLTWTVSRTDTYDVSGDLPREFENNVGISSLGAGILYDGRDAAWFPRSGWLASALGEVASGAIGSQLEFVRFTANVVKLVPLGSRYVLALRAGGGAIDPYGKTPEIPIQERFFLGGADTVRSFTTDNLGPRVLTMRHGELTTTNSPAGGEFYSVANIELRAPLLGPLQFAMFADGGNVIRQVKDAGFQNYRFAVGGGLRIVTPIGPLRIDAGLNPSPTDSEDQWAIFFAVGYPF